ncbi:MAG: hypothetical protein ACRD1T_10390 [Acidimicrobiia bacterium]
MNEALENSRALVDRTGTYLKIESSGVDVASDRAVEVLKQLGYRGEVTDRIDPEPERWYGIDEAEELSIEESRVLAERWIVEAKQEGLLDEDQATDARDPLAEVILGAIRPAATSGEPGRLGLEALTNTLSAGVNTETRERIRTWLSNKLS